MNSAGRVMILLVGLTTCARLVGAARLAFAMGGPRNSRPFEPGGGVAVLPRGPHRFTAPRRSGSAPRRAAAG